MMTVEENKVIVCQYNGRMDAGDTSVLDELTTSGLVVHHMGDGVDVGREALKQDASNLYTSFPDSSMILEDIIAEKDKVALRRTFRGTRTTGDKITISQFAIYRLEKGKIAEIWLLAFPFSW